MPTPDGILQAATSSKKISEAAQMVTNELMTLGEVLSQDGYEDVVDKESFGAAAQAALDALQALAPMLQEMETKLEEKAGAMGDQPPAKTQPAPDAAVA